MVIATLPKAIDNNWDFRVQLPDHSSSHAVRLHYWGAHWLVYHVCDVALFDPVLPVACSVPLAVPPTAHALVHSKVTAMCNTACAALQTQAELDAIVPIACKHVWKGSTATIRMCCWLAEPPWTAAPRLEAKEGLKQVHHSRAGWRVLSAGPHLGSFKKSGKTLPDMCCLYCGRSLSARHKFPQLCAKSCEFWTLGSHHLMRNGAQQHKHTLQPCTVRLNAYRLPMPGCRTYQPARPCLKGELT